jgi:hypothetical protein
MALARKNDERIYRRARNRVVPRVYWAVVTYAR